MRIILIIYHYFILFCIQGFAMTARPGKDANHPIAFILYSSDLKQTQSDKKLCNIGY